MMASGAQYWTYPSSVDRVVDGDTVRLLMDLGLRIYRIDNVRLAHINCPETNTPEGKRAKEFAFQLLIPGENVVFVSKSLDKYGRPLGTIQLPNGADYGQTMIANGHAVPYEG